MTTETPQLTELKLLQKSKTLELLFADNTNFVLSCEYLRVFSPSAEVQGHGNAPMKIVPGKKHVNITSVEPVGHYGVKLIFDDEHASGIYSWQTLYDLGKNFKSNWQTYLTGLEKAGLARE